MSIELSPELTDAILRIIEISLTLLGAFGGAYFGAKKAYEYSLKAEKAFRNENASRYCKTVLKQLERYATILEDYQRRQKETDLIETEDEMIDYIRSIQKGEKYYEIPQVLELESVIDLLLDQKYTEARVRLRTMKPQLTK